MPVEANEFVIVGVTRDGRQFRPSDWAERLCGVTSRLDVSNRMQYSPYVQPAMADGMKCVVVDVRLKETAPLAYRFLENFPRDNELVVRAGGARLAPPRRRRYRPERRRDLPPALRRAP